MNNRQNITIFSIYAIILFCVETYMLLSLTDNETLPQQYIDALTILLLIITIVNFCIHIIVLFEKEPSSKKEWILLIINSILFQFRVLIEGSKVIMQWLKDIKPKFKNFITYWQNLPDE